MPQNTKQSLDHIFELAVVANWKDLMQDRQSGLIHVEYGYSSIGTVDGLQLWSSVKRGHWRLSCEYSSRASSGRERGVHFENAARSGGLSSLLELVLKHQNMFEIPTNLGRRGLLQITQPTAEESAAASVSAKEIFVELASHSV